MSQNEDKVKTMATDSYGQWATFSSRENKAGWGVTHAPGTRPIGHIGHQEDNQDCTFRYNTRTLIFFFWRR